MMDIPHYVAEEWALKARDRAAIIWFLIGVLVGVILGASFI